MKSAITFNHVFVDAVPEKLSDRTLYVSMGYATAVHKCACGCGAEIVTPISPTDWKLTFDGEAVSLNPSIGNWGLDCRAHYFITGNQARWAGDMTQTQIEAGRHHSRSIKEARLVPKNIPLRTNWWASLFKLFRN